MTDSTPAPPRCRGIWMTGKNTCPCADCTEGARLRWAWISASEAVHCLHTQGAMQTEAGIMAIVRAEIARERAGAAWESWGNPA